MPKDIYDNEIYPGDHIAVANQTYERKIVLLIYEVLGDNRVKMLKRSDGLEPSERLEKISFKHSVVLG